MWQPVRKLDEVLNADFHNPIHSNFGTGNTKLQRNKCATFFVNYDVTE